MTAPLIVLGSANRDYTVVVPRHPAPGETVLGHRFVSGTGGKGANQALAAARAGAAPVFIGAVGTDAAGRDILDDLANGGVDTALVHRDHAEPTGVALITVADDGENSIVVAPGANGSLEPAGVTETVSGFAAEDGVLLAQLEIPVDAVLAGALAAARAGARVVLNLSPARAVPAELLALADPLVVNESEAAWLAGTPVDTVEQAVDAADRLLATSRSVVVTLGGDGVVVASDDTVSTLPAERVTVVDTTGAGDAFVGALAARLAAGDTLEGAVLAGIGAGAAAVQHLGAQPPTVSA